MGKVQAMKKAIGADVFEKLGYAGATHAGRVVVLADDAAMTVLRREGVVGENDGLTIVGSGVAMLAQKHVEDMLF